MPRSDSDGDQELRDLQRAMSVQGTTVAGLPSGSSVAADPEAIQAWERRRAAQREAYGQFVANSTIWIGNAPVFTEGQPVPLEHVINFDLVEREQVNRVASPELARVGRVFDSDQEFLAANPHVARQVREQARRAEAAGDALDPRGGAAARDDAKRAGKDVSAPTAPGADSDERREAAAESLIEVRDSDQEETKSTGAKARRTTKTTQEG
jgi:hypothetical protein